MYAYRFYHHMLYIERVVCIYATFLWDNFARVKTVENAINLLELSKQIIDIQKSEQDWKSVFEFRLFLN